MTPPTLPLPRRWRATVHLAAVALLLTACAGSADDPAPGEAPGDEPASSTDDDADATDTGAADGDDATAASPEELSAVDGWNGDLHDLDLPEPGAGVLTVDGETIDLAVTCTGPDDPTPLILFSFRAKGEGVDAQGRAVTVDVERRIVGVEEAATSVYEYQGQEYGSIQIVTATGDDSSPFHSAIEVTPGDADPTGSLLPLVRAEEGGSFTVVADVPPLASMHDQALHGATELAGTCPA